jgi:wyosine [tRNA(Phe)-imidazoG37] synthetase (radical SAM superfamily)
VSNIIFGPVNSRRFGTSLGIDLSPAKKQCNFDCLYCELDKAKTVDTQSEVVLLDDVKSALLEALARHADIDVVTVTANGEPTLYPYLDDLGEFLQALPQKTLILSNASTIADAKIRRILSRFDTVKLSLDCASERCFKKLDRPYKSIMLESIIGGLKEFAKTFQNELIIEVLFVQGINDTEKEVAAINDVLLQINPSRIDIGTVDRPPAYDVKALSYEKLFALSHYFDASLPVTVVSRDKAKAKAQNYDEGEILNTLSKRPLTKEDIDVLFNEATKKRFDKLLNAGMIMPVVKGNHTFYKA